MSQHRMSFLSIDHSEVLSDDGLYTGEEVCASLVIGSADQSDDNMSGIVEQFGVEMELDVEVLSSMNVSLDITMEEEDSSKEDEPHHDSLKEDESQHITVDDDEPEPTPPALTSVDQDGHPVNVNLTVTTITTRPTPIIVTIGQAVNKSISPRSVRTKLRSLRRHLFTKGISSKLKSYAPNNCNTPCSSPKARRVLSDNCSCDMTHASHNSSSIASGSHDDNNDDDDDDDDSDCCANHETLPNTPSSITASTCDFSPDINHHAVFESYLVTNPWEAAKRGDYATLSYIANHDDANIWTMEDDAGHVPLYYACMAYSKEDGLSFGKYGFESIKLLVRVWPVGVELPEELLEACNYDVVASLLELEEDEQEYTSKEMNNNDYNSSNSKAMIHNEVVEVLSRSLKSKGRILQRPPLLGSIGANLSDICEENNRIDGVSDVVPVSFLEDLGDDGYVEDY